MTLLAQQRRDANEWLARTPLVLVLGALALGLALVGWGVAGLLSGRAKSKWGAEFEGNKAAVISIVRLVAGVGLLAFGVYKAAF
ncbi:MAG: hypothetical protein WCL32_25030 [Planctomycetota bacterium]